MKRKNYVSVTEALTGLKKLGYTINFSLYVDKECLICSLPAIELSSEDFDIDHFYKFNVDGDPNDEIIIYAISSKQDDLKGIVLKACGIDLNYSSSAIVRKLEDFSNQSTINFQEDPAENQESLAKDKFSISPEGSCPICWGRQEYDGKIRVLLKDKQIDVNNHKDNYMIIQEFMKHNIDGITLKESIVIDCPNCSKGKPKIQK